MCLSAGLISLTRLDRLEPRAVCVHTIWLFTLSKICWILAAGTQPSLRMLMVPVGNKHKGICNGLMLKLDLRGILLCARVIRCTFIDPQAVDHCGAHRFVGVPVTQNPLDLVSQSTADANAQTQYHERTTKKQNNSGSPMSPAPLTACVWNSTHPSTMEW